MTKATRKLLFKYFLLPNERRIKIIKKVLKDSIIKEEYEHAQWVNDLVIQLSDIQNNTIIPNEHDMEIINIKYNEIIYKALEDGVIE